MKKSRLQVIIDFISQVRQLKPDKKEEEKNNAITSAKKLKVILLLIFCIQVSGFATTYYSRGTGNWNANASWSTVGYGNPTNTGTFPKAGDIANIGDGHVINITNNAVCATLNIGQGVSGIVEYKSTANFTITVSGNTTINTGGKLWYNTATNRTHQFTIGGNFTNFGIVDFFLSANRLVNLTFNTSGNSIVTGTGTWDLNNVSMVKSTFTSATVNVTSATFEAGIRNLIATYGTYIHNNSSVYNINPTTSTFTIGPNVIFKVQLGTMNFASAADNLLLQGSLYVNGGTVNVGTTTGLQGIRSDRNGTFVPYLEVSSGSLTVYGGITYNAASAAEPFSFKMTGGTILLNSGLTGTNRQVFCLTDVATSVFNMTAGTITIQKPNILGATMADFSLCGNLGTVTTTGGTVVFGNGITTSGLVFNFKPFANITQPHFRVSGQAGLPNTLATSNASIANFKLLSLYIETGKTFDIRSIAGATGDTKTMTLLGTANGVDALYNNGTFTARQSTVTFNTTGAQAIGGASVTTFYNLSINNTNNITLNKAANISNYLSMVNGKLITTNTNVLTCGSAANASLGSNTSFVDGPLIQTVASAAPASRTFPIGKGTSYRASVLTVQHSDVTPVTYRSEIFNIPAATLPYSYPSSISNVSNVRYTKILRQNIGNFVNGQIRMYYDLDDGVADKNTLAVAHDDGSSLWVNIGGTATANWTGNILSGTFTTFNSFFTLANPPGGGNPLPIELAAFSASLNNNKKVDVKWVTESEINNDFFTVQRSSDNENFSPVTTIDGSGNSTQTHNYTFTDNEPLPGISYYRLVQTDFDGNEVEYPSTVINYKKSGLVRLYPNPSTSNHVYVSGSEDLTSSTVTVQDITGKIIPSKSTLTENGIVDIQIDEAYTSKGGIFIVYVTNGEISFREKLLIN